MNVTVHLAVWCAQGSKDALYNLYGVSLNNVYDLQLPESAFLKRIESGLTNN